MRGRGGVGASEDGPFVAAVSDVLFFSFSELGGEGEVGDGSPYRSSICYFV